MTTAIAAKAIPNSPPHDDVDFDQDNNDSGDNKQGLVRPPPRPFKRANLSLEQNPFEVSFSVSQSSVPPASPRAVSRENANNSDASTNNRSNSEDSKNMNGHSRNDSNGGSKSSPKPTLPPLSAIADGTREGANNFAWGFSSALNDTAGSLRSGPLSPAMLPGPRQQDGANPSANPAGPNHPNSHGYFDVPLSFRTGLTPGIGRTGLTPLVGGPASFPPPSPNTAAFLAMVTNGTNGGAGAQPGTITPNTLSALTGTLMQHAANGVDAPSNSSNQQSAANPNQPHPLSVSRVVAYGAANNGANAGGAPGDQSQAYRSSGVDPASTGNYAGAAQNAAAAAANGLFLLSQAHQELTKREEQAQAAAAEAAAAAAGINTRSTAAARRGSTMNSTASAPMANGHNKRKSGDATAPTQAPRPNGGKRARGSTTGSSTAAANSVSPTQATRASGRRKKSEPSFMNVEVGSPEDEDDSMDEDEMAMESGAQGAAGGRGASKKFETEEEKRRNFLERNRMAALKCRQRKKAWLNQLQQQVEYLKTENERLQGTIVSMRDEVTRLSAVIVAHRSCGLGGVVVPAYAAQASAGNDDAHGSPAGSQSPVVSVAPVSVPVSVPPGGHGGAHNNNGGGYGY